MMIAQTWSEELNFECGFFSQLSILEIETGI